jgi:hypothetical protein
MIHRIEVQAGPEGIIVLNNLPIEEGEIVEILVITSRKITNPAQEYSLQGVPVYFDRPFDPVAEGDWGALP